MHLFSYLKKLLKNDEIFNSLCFICDIYFFNNILKNYLLIIKKIFLNNTKINIKDIINFK
jgi:hypothetical protein